MTDETTEAVIDTGNYQGVAIGREGIIVLSPQTKMTKAQALLHAAWLVALADDPDKAEFGRLLDAVQNT